MFCVYDKENFEVYSSLMRYYFPNAVDNADREAIGNLYESSMIMHACIKLQVVEV